MEWKDVKHYLFMLFYAALCVSGAWFFVWCLTHFLQIIYWIDDVLEWFG